MKIALLVCSYEKSITICQLGICKFIVKMIVSVTLLVFKYHPSISNNNKKKKKKEKEKESLSEVPLFGFASGAYEIN